MKALVKTRKGDGFIELREVEEPVLKENEVLIKVKAVSICGSDLHIYHDEHPYWPPMIMGHEFSGEISKVGNKVKGWKVGDRVVSETRTGSCGTCRYCQTGFPQLCPEKRPPGIGRDGAMASYLTMPANLLHRIPDNISFEEAAVTEPTAVCVHSLFERTGINPGDIVVINGQGPIGLICLQLAKIAGASKVIVSEISHSALLKLEKAKELGADKIVDIGNENLKDIVIHSTNGYGADFLIETSGASNAIKESFNLVRRQGKICAIGINGKETTEIPWDVGIFKAIQLTFCFSSSWSSWEKTLSLMEAGQLKVKELITHEVPLEKWKEMFKMIEQGEAIKVILKP